LIDEIHIAVWVCRGLRPNEYSTVCRTLKRATSQSALRKSLRSVFGRYRSLTKVQVDVSLSTAASN
jgi:hypothetical protein